MQYKKSMDSAFAAGCGALAMLASTGVQALSFDYNELEIDLQTAVSAGLAVRAESADKDIISKANNADALQAAGSSQGAYSANIDDGNLAFPDAGDLFFGQFKVSSDLTLQVGDWGIFARGNYRYDPRVKSAEVFDDFDYANDGSRTRTLADKRAREDEVDDALATDAELFDLYLFGRFDAFGRDASIRIGRQVLNWGESIFIQNGINSIIPVDARQARGPGAEVKEIFRPFGMAWGSVNLVENVSLEAFYQFQWEPTIADPAGSYFSTADFIGDGDTAVQLGGGRCNEHLPPGSCAFAPGGTDLTRSPDDEPEDGGQYGARLTVLLPAINYTEVSFYGLNYHSRLPILSGTKVADASQIGNPATARYFTEYPEDIKLYGVSFNSYIQPLNISIQGEYSLKQDQPLQIDDAELLLAVLGVPAPAQTYTTEVGPVAFGEDVTGFQRFDVHQADLVATKIIGPNWTGANQVVLLGEVSGMHVSGLPEKSELPFEGVGTFVPNQTAGAMAIGTPAQDRAGFVDASSWGYRLLAAFTYINVFDRFELTPRVTFFHDVNGNSPGPIRNHIEGTKQASVGVNANYLSAWEAGLSYTVFWGGQNISAGPDAAVGERAGGLTNNLRNDRDFVNLFVRYTF